MSIVKHVFWSLIITQAWCDNWRQKSMRVTISNVGDDYMFIVMSCIFKIKSVTRDASRSAFWFKKGILDHTLHNDDSYSCSKSLKRWGCCQEKKRWRIHVFQLRLTLRSSFFLPFAHFLLYSFLMHTSILWWEVIFFSRLL